MRQLPSLYKLYNIKHKIILDTIIPYINTLTHTKRVYCRIQMTIVTITHPVMFVAFAVLIN